MTAPGTVAAGASGRHHLGVAIARLDEDSAAWVRDLDAAAPEREAAISRLRALLLRIARAEASRRAATLPERGRDEVDDLCHQAANDAVLTVLRKLPEFRGEARFTTWACKFAMFEISTRLRRHAWRQYRVENDARVWDTLADSGPLALVALQQSETLEFLRRAIREQLTERQRLVFQAAVLEDVPIDVLADRLGSSRGAIYKVLHDARRTLRRAVARAGEELT